MKSATCAFIFVVFSCVATVFGQSAADECLVIRAALSHHLNRTLPYVSKWLVDGKTAALPFGHWDDPQVRLAEDDYVERNKGPIDIAKLESVAKASFVDLSQFSRDATIDWSAVEAKFGTGTWAARVSRPAFFGTTAVVRIDVFANGKDITASTVAILKKSGNGAWTFVTSLSTTADPAQVR